MAIPAWLTLSNNSGSGDSVVTITASSYNELTARTASLTVSGNTKSVNIGVLQEGTGVWAVSPDYVLLSDIGGMTYLDIVSPYDNWYIVNNTAWVSFNVLSGVPGSYSIEMTIDQNSNPYGRNGSFTVTDGNNTTEVSIEQAGTGEMSVSPTSFSFGVMGGTGSFTVTAYTNWHTSVIPFWLHLSQESGGTGVTVVNFTADTNMSSARSVTFEVDDLFTGINITVSQDTNVLEVSPTALTFTSRGSVSQFVVTSYFDWEISGPAWLHFSQTIGTSGTTVVSVSADPNNSYSIRSDTFSVYDGGLTVNVSVSQDASVFSTTPSRFLFEWDGETKKFMVNSYVNNWEITNYPAWLSFSETTGGTGSTLVRVTATQNSGVSSRTGTFMVGDGVTSVTCTVEQDIYVPYEEMYLTFKILSDGDLNWYGEGVNRRTIEYRIDGGAWSSVTATAQTGGIGTKINVTEGDRVEFRGNNVSYYAFVPVGSFRYSSASFNVYGNSMSLIYGDDFENKQSLPTDSTFREFLRNTNAVSARNLILPATSTTTYCYNEMFNSCTLLEYAPKLPGTTSSEACYSNMFSGCTSLLDAPDLPATSMTQNCYMGMFRNCTSLLVTPELPATVMATGCYSDMFAGCTSLLIEPELPATVMAQSCYREMFKDCTGLTRTPVLSASTLATTCYESMFSGCTSLTTGPELPATTMETFCYYRMFAGCTSLTTAPGLSATTLALNCYDSMFQGCTALIVAPELSTTTLAGYCYYHMFSGCTSLATAPELPATVLTEACYNSMFAGCTSLITAPQLPATSLTNYCYGYMFNGCTSLMTAPELPATALTEDCYKRMFQGCTSLTTAPDLPATTLVDYCYEYLYDGCTSLVTPPSILPATTLAYECYQYMFNGCTSLTTAPQLPATSLTYGCYLHMFDGCTALTTAPELSAATLASFCYFNMFSGCTSLNYVKCLATSLGTQSTRNWLAGVAPTGTFVKASSMSWTTGANGIPSGWSVVDAT